MRTNTRDMFIASAARIGLSARAAVYLLVGGLAIWAVTLGGGQTEQGPQEAFLALDASLAGRAVIALIALGLVLYALWRFLQGVVDTDNAGTDAKGRIARLGMVASGISYLALAIAAGMVLIGRSNGAAPDSTERFARWLLELPAGLGVVLLVAAALLFAAVGVAQIWRAWTRQFQRGLAHCRTTRRLAPVCAFGIGGRGVLFLLVAWFLVYAAEDADPDEAMGAAELMGWLRDQFFGLPLYLTAASALLGYAAYSLIQARYRHIGTDV